MDISFKDGKISAENDPINVSKDITNELIRFGRYDGERLSPIASSTVRRSLDEVLSSVRLLLSLIKYHLRHFDIKEGSFSIKSQQWSVDGTTFREIPSSISISVESLSSHPLNERSKALIQESLNSNIQPLAAMRHLHRAKNESAPHHKYIDATIAAELAIKEVLCRAHPHLEKMLIEMPSPPLSKMYGSLLKHYMNEESPFRKSLIKGQEQRNILVHRPGAISIDPQEAIDYVSTVEAAIFHLLSLLYPHDKLILQTKRRHQIE